MTEASGKPDVAHANDVENIFRYISDLLYPEGENGELTEDAPDSGLHFGHISIDPDDSGIDISAFIDKGEDRPSCSEETEEGLLKAHLLRGFFNGWVLIEYSKTGLGEYGRSIILSVRNPYGDQVEFDVAEGGKAKLGADWKDAYDIVCDRNGFNISFSNNYWNGNYRIERPSQPGAEPKPVASE